MSKRPLYINLDETAVAMAMPSLRGLVLGKLQWPGGRVPHQKVSRATRRAMMTHVCMITHNANLQKQLPQYFLASKRCFTQTALNALDVLPGEVIFLRRKSAWNTGSLMVQILRRLATVVEPYRDTFQPILVLDAAKVHLAAEVIAAAAAHNIWLQVVPTLCTHLLQPCDTHCFSAYKAYLKQRYRAAKDCSGSVGMSQWLEVLVELCSNFLLRDWNKAFEQTGLTGDRTKLLRELQPYATHVIDGPMEAPEFHRVQGLLPKRQRFNYFQLIGMPLS